MNDVFEVYYGGDDEMLAVRVRRDREMDTFCVHAAAGKLIVSGALEHVMAELEHYLMRIHGELPDAPA